MSSPPNVCTLQPFWLRTSSKQSSKTMRAVSSRQLDAKATISVPLRNGAALRKFHGALQQAESRHMKCTFQSEQWVPYPVEAVFAFFADPRNLPALMPNWQNARLEHASIVAPSRSGAEAEMAGIGSRITLSFRPLPGIPFRVRWEAEITDFVLTVTSLTVRSRALSPSGSTHIGFAAWIVPELTSRSSSIR